MHLTKLNGWQRLWVLASVIWLIVVIWIAAPSFPTRQNTFIGDDDVTKNLSDKTLKIVAKPGGRYDIVETLPNGIEFYLPPGTSQADIGYVRNDYSNTYKKMVRKKRISFTGLTVMIWIVPCLVIYALGVSFNWVYEVLKQRKRIKSGVKFRER